MKHNLSDVGAPLTWPSRRRTGLGTSAAVRLSKHYSQHLGVPIDAWVSLLCPPHGVRRGGAGDGNLGGPQQSLQLQTDPSLEPQQKAAKVAQLHV